MDPALKNRIDRAWGESKNWIAEFDGSPTITLLVNIPVEALYPAIQNLARQSENFRLTRIPTGKDDPPQFIPLDSFPDALALLQKNELAELNLNYAVRAPAFDLDVHVILHPLPEEKAALELVWWSDQVFSSETDDFAQFQALAEYFVDLQKTFLSSQIFLSKESGLEHNGNGETWVEI